MNGKRIILIPLLLLTLLLTGCSRFVIREYETVSPHAGQHTEETDEDVLTVQNYLSLKNAILTFVENGVEKGVIRTRDYSGEVEEDLSAAAYEVSKLDPLGAYAVDYMTHDCARFVSYYEIHISITFRRNVEQIGAIRRVGSNAALPELIDQALASYEPALTVRLSYYDGQDMEALVRDYYAFNPGKAMELPEVTVNVYPESGYVRIVELLFNYSESAEALLQKQEAVASNVRAAGEYVRYRSTGEGKLRLLYTYLQERFRYTPGLSSTPVYSFLCEGVAGDEGCAKSLQLVCEQIGLECHTVAGNRSGEPYSWNIVNVDDRYCHIDLFRALAEEADNLPFYADGELEDYYWDQDAFPGCPAAEPADAPGEPDEDGLTETSGETALETEET